MIKARILLTIALLASTVVRAQNATEIVRRANELMHGVSTVSVMSMTVVKPEWSRTVAMNIWALEPDYALVLVTAPARDKGSVTLKRKTEVWNWLPSVQRVIKIPPSMMLQPWMGSDFTNDDLVRQASIVNDYTHRIIGTDTLEGRRCWKIELVPKPEAGVVWGKQIMWISQKDDMELRVEYYDEDGALAKSFCGSAVRNFNGRSFPSHWEMLPVHEDGNKTILEYESVRFDVRLDPAFFSEQNMKNVR